MVKDMTKYHFDYHHVSGAYFEEGQRIDEMFVVLAALKAYREEKK